MERAREADYILVSWTPVSGRVIEAGRRLKLIQKHGIGMDKIDLATAAGRGVLVAFTAGGNAVGVAELAIAHMLALYRKLCVADGSLRRGRWLKWELRTNCYELCGKTVGIVGGGNIGRALAKRLTHGFECRVLYYDKYRLPAEKEAELGMAYTAMDDLLRQADIVSLHVPLTPETRGLIGARELSLMKPSAVLINISRGAVVDEPALISALRNQTIAGAGLDVFTKEPPDADNPLFQMENVVVTPHYGGGTVDTMINVLRHSFSNIERVERGEPLPEADVARA